MNNISKKTSYLRLVTVFLSIIMILSTSITFFSNNANAEDNNTSIADENIENLSDQELEKELTYIYGNIIILDEDGTAKDVNLKNAKEHYGYVPDAFQKLKNDLNNRKMAQSTSTRAVGDNYKNSRDCFYSEVLNSYGELLSGNIIAAAFDDVKAHNISALAKKLGRIGVKGNLAGIAATMVSKDAQCTFKYGYL